MKSYVSVCSKPWEELVVYPNLEYSICCGGPPVGKIEQREDIKDLWNNHIVQHYRRSLLNNVEQGICKNCIFNSKLRNLDPNEMKRDPSLKPDGNKIKVLSFGPTEQCNLNCFMCGFTKKYLVEQGIKNRISDPRVQILPFWAVEEFAKHHFRDLEIFNTNCFGEIFLYPHFDDFMDLIEEYKPNGKLKETLVTTTTSGSLKISEKKWDKLLNVHNNLVFSIDSFDPEIHQVVRGFDIQRFYDNLDIVRDLKESKYHNLEYGFSLVFMKINVGGFYEFAQKTIEELGANLLHFQHCIDYPTQSLSGEKEWRQLYNRQLSKVNLLLEKNPHVKINGNIGYFKDKDGKVEGLEDGVKVSLHQSPRKRGKIEKKSKDDVIYEIQDNFVFEGKFSVLDKKDNGPFMYFLNFNKEPVMQLIMSDGKLIFSYHEGIDTWVPHEISDISSDLRIEYSVDTSEVKINNKLLSDIVDFSSYSHNFDKCCFVSNHDSRGSGSPLGFTKFCLDKNIKKTESGNESIGDLIGAFYYTWYYDDGWEEKVYRKQKYGGKPYLDWYKGDDPDLIRKHIQMAQHNGIDFFILSYNGKHDLESLRLFKKIAKEENFKFALHYETVNIFGDPIEFNPKNRLDFLDSIMSLCSSFLLSGNYLKIDGKPVFFIYTSRRILGDLSEIEVIRQRVREKLDIDLYLCGDEVWWPDNDWIGDEKRLEKFDAIYPYNLYTCIDEQGNEGFVGDDYLKYIQKPYDDFYAKCKKLNIDMIPVAMPRYGDFAYRTIEGHYEIPSQDGEFFKKYLSMCEKYVLGDQKMYLITSFNEWYEDTQIEPYRTSHSGDSYDENPSYGTKYLEIVKNFSEKIKA